MAAIPKPEHCGQNWLEMKPTAGGRICRQCDKKIVDFSKMSWSEIETIQKQNNNSVCGMYHPRQLDNWGKEIPANNKSLRKAATITGLTLSFATSSFGQSTTGSNSVVIQGKVIDGETAQELPGVVVKLKACKAGAFTDADGNFKIVVKNIPSKPLPDTLEIYSIEFQRKQIAFKDINEINTINKDTGEIRFEDGIINVSLSPSTGKVIAFYVHRPTLLRRIKWGIGKIFWRK